MTIGKKIIGGYAVVLVLMVLVAAVAIYTLRSVVESYTSLLDRETRAMIAAENLDQEASEQVALYRGSLLYPAGSAARVSDLRASHRRFESLLESVSSLSQSEEARRLLLEIDQTHKKLEAAQEEGITLAQAGKSEQALALGETLVPLSRQVRDETGEYSALQEKALSAGRAGILQTKNSAMIMLSTISLLATILGIGLGIVLTRSISTRLRETIAQLSAASAEILATTSQVAAGAAETAASVSETTATVEEVKQTAQVSNQKARLVSDSAQRVAQVAHSGMKAVEGTIEGMHRIQEQMESVADSVVRLSEQSQSIGEIIATVNDLAEQSNLLAVNAAIEAARAGDQGKGFSVVAQEVKSLADQSRQATAQVRSILGEIQKATSAAALATEQGHKAVEVGVRQSNDAGASIRLLGESVNEAAQASTQIAASSQQQMVGMDQVAMAMANIKQASLQNVSGTRQAEVAAQNLHELGRRLGAMIEAQGR